jgi:5-enolpyruvylshikimate-3-phosphate synthase
MLPGSKSLTNRVLIIAALSKGRVKIDRMSFSEDT